MKTNILTTLCDSRHPKGHVRWPRTARSTGGQGDWSRNVSRDGGGGGGGVGGGGGDV